MNNNMKEHNVQIGGINTHYWECGEGEPLILLHGGGAGADGYGNWSPIMPLYAKKGFHTIAIDAVGFGMSSKPSPEQFTYDQEARVNQLVGLIKELGLDNVTMIGNSMGGFTSIGATLAIPERINKMVLMGTGKPKANSDGFKSLLNYTIGRDFMYNIVRNLTNESYEVQEDMLQYRLKLTQQPGIMEAYVSTMEGIVKFELDMDAVSTIQHKTLVVHGMKDVMVPIENSFELTKAIANSRLYVIPNCGHWAMMEYPEEFARVTIDFIRHQ
jgi:2-hydroxy-6-oxo-6-(2'-aminophenyl)hexa-2,4-dienoate hydrolase